MITAPPAPEHAETAARARRHGPQARRQADATREAGRQGPEEGGRDRVDDPTAARTASPTKPGDAKRATAKQATAKRATTKAAATSATRSAATKGASKTGAAQSTTKAASRTTAGTPRRRHARPPAATKAASEDGDLVTAEPRVVVHPDKQSLADAAAARFVTALIDAQTRNPEAQVALTGGSMGSAIIASVLAHAGPLGRRLVTGARVVGRRALPAGR